MKKFYIATAALFIGGSMLAQNKLGKLNVQPLPLKFATNIHESANTGLNQNKALGTAIWSDDFSTPANWTIDNAAQAAPFGWNIGTTVNSWAFSSPINSTSGGNFAELYNGDPSTGNPAPVSQTFTMTTASSIDVNTLSSGNNQVKIEFDQYGAMFQDMQEIYVSTDGVNFTLVGDNSDIPPLTSSGGSAYPNPMHRSFDISTAIAGNPSTVWIRFSWSPGVQNITYGWMIDDVALVTKADWDLQYRTSGWGSLGLNYYQIPLLQVQPIDFWGKASNEGSQNLTNVMFNVDINTGAFTGASNGVTIAPMNSDSLGSTTQFTPSSNGTYSATRSFTLNETDDIPTNNTIPSVSFSVNDFIYARDNGTSAGSVSNQGLAYEIGNLFDIVTTDTLYAVNVTINTASQGNPIIYGKVYSIDQTSGNFVEEGNTVEYTVDMNVDPGNEIVLGFYNTTGTAHKPILTAGQTYLVVVGSYGDGGATTDLAVSAAGTSDPQTTFLYDIGGSNGTANTWYYMTSTPMVRMNFQTMYTGIEDNQANTFKLGQSFPNPTNGTAQINYELYKAGKVSFEVTDMSGKVISYTNLGNKGAGANVYTIDASSLTSGMYYYTMIVDGERVTRKFTVQK